MNGGPLTRRVTLAVPTAELAHACRPGVRWLSIVDDLDIERFVARSIVARAVQLTNGQRGRPLGAWSFVVGAGVLWPMLVCEYQGAGVRRGRLELAFNRAPWVLRTLDTQAKPTKADTARPLFHQRGPVLPTTRYKRSCSKQGE